MLILKPSKIHGVGVFTTTPIKIGVALPLFDEHDWDRIEKPYGHKRRYCVKEKTHYYCPQNWNRMSIGWYINDSKTPNIEVTNWSTIHYIASGSELLIDYRDLE